MVTANHADKQKQESDRLLWAFWHGEAMRRQQRLIQLDRLLRKPMKEQTDDEMWEAMETWVATHNARYNAERMLGVNAEE